MSIQPNHRQQLYIVSAERMPAIETVAQRQSPEISLEIIATSEDPAIVRNRVAYQIAAYLMPNIGSGGPRQEQHYWRILQQIRKGSYAVKLTCDDLPKFGNFWREVGEYKT